MADVTLTSPDRVVVLWFPRLHEITGERVAIYSNGTIAGNGDGIAGGTAPVNYAGRLGGPLDVWPSGRQGGFLNGGFCRGGFCEGGARREPGFGFLHGPFLEGSFLCAGGRFQYKVPFPLRNGVHVFAVRLLDTMNNEAAITAEVSVSVEAIPRPASNVRSEGYDDVARQINISWSASPDLL